MGFSPAHQASAKRPLFRGKFHAFKPLFCFRAQAAESGLTAQTTWGLDPEKGLACFGVSLSQCRLEILSCPAPVDAARPSVGEIILITFLTISI